MLAGRAWQFFLFPFTHIELGNRFSLDDAVLRGTLPPIIDESSQDGFRTLTANVQTDLKEEILDEALVRNIGAFSRFLDMAADQSGKIVNFSTISRETGVSSKTIKGYYEILEDPLIAIKLEPYRKNARKRLTMRPKYYLFYIAVINAITGRTSISRHTGQIPSYPQKWSYDDEIISVDELSVSALQAEALQVPLLTPCQQCTCLATRIFNNEHPLIAQSQTGKGKFEFCPALVSQSYFVPIHKWAILGYLSRWACHADAHL